jgi:hypothetical protein
VHPDDSVADICPHRLGECLQKSALVFCSHAHGPESTALSLLCNVAPCCGSGSGYLQPAVSTSGVMYCRPTQFMLNLRYLLPGSASKTKPQMAGTV